MDLKNEMRLLAERARKASLALAHANPMAKKQYLECLALLLCEREKEILAANSLDVSSARNAGLDTPRIDRLTLTSAIIAEMAEGCRQIAAMPDPVGAMETQWQRPNGLLVGKMRVPLGVIAMIYEARPNVAIDAAALCVKAGNAVILRGGKEAAHSSSYLASLLAEAARQAALPQYSAQLVENYDHAAVRELCRMDDLIDVVIPRGGENLIRAVCEAATVPVLKHYKGVCHIYVDESANLENALDIVENAKTQRPGVCNAVECLIVNSAIAARFLPMLAERLAPRHVEFRADGSSLPLLGPKARLLQPADLGMEFHALVLAVVTVDGLDQAIAHIDRYGSRHTEVICTENYGHAMRFLREVDASMVGVNASTRFNDGGQLGLGAEIGISTSKLHAYGPMGVNELTTTKFTVLGSGQIRS